MSTLEKLKAEAAMRERLARASGQTLKHCTSLELVAKSHGYGNWRACRAALSGGVQASRAETRKGHKIADMEMKHYQSKDWNFGLDIPRRWNAFPAVSSNSPYEIIRFASHEEGVDMLIVFRTPYDPQKGPAAHAEAVRAKLTQEGFANFAICEIKIGSRQVLMLNCNKPCETGTWSVREYFIFDGTLAYTLGFGTNKWESKVGLYEHMARSFDVMEESLA